MQSLFQFQAPVRLVCGAGAVERVGVEAATLAVSKVLVCTDKGVMSSGVVERVLLSLKAANVSYALFDEVEPNPSIITIEKGLRLLQAEKCGAVIGVGGGSPMDAAKAIALWDRNPGRLQDYEGADKVKNPCLPGIAVPTTAGTGSEVSMGLVVTDTNRKYKMSLRTIYNLPKVAILDPLLLAGLPGHIAAACGMDALTHAVEAYTSTWASPFTDSIALGAIRLVAENLRPFVANRGNVEAASNMFCASSMGAMAFVWARLGLAHAIALPLGGHFDLPHGLATALALPHVMRYNLISNPRKFADIAKVFDEDTSYLDIMSAAERSVCATERLMQDIGITQRLSDFGVTPDSIAILSEDAMKTGMTATNPRTVDAATVATILRQIL